MIQGLSRRWQMATPADHGEALARALHIDPLIADLLARRGATDAQSAQRFLAPQLTHLHDPRLLPNCTAAAKRIVDALRADEPIAIFGDYDVDGVTATAILYHMLRTCRADATILRYIPHRIDEGYGINAQALAGLCERGAKVIISVDCGITAIEPAKVAAQHGVDLIITDHHEMGDELPQAYAIVHPALRETRNITIDGGDSPYPFAELCGAGVAYKLAWQIARCWCNTERVPEVFRVLLVDLLSLAALGTVADVVPLVDENRSIVRHGLGRIKNTPFAGLNALIDASNLRDEKIDAVHVGFVLGPRLNACGRMGHAISACKLLTDAQSQEAMDIAQFLESENNNRRKTEREIFTQAQDMVRQRGYDKDSVRAIVLDSPDWHPGVVGIVCSRLVDVFNRPTILLNSSNGIAQGSGRSIDGFNLFEALHACSKHLQTFGGHAMAAGLKIEPGRIDAFRTALIEYANDRLSPADLVPGLMLEAMVNVRQLSQTVVEQIESLAPFGRGNEAPMLLLKGGRIADVPRTVGAQSRHLVLSIEQDGRYLRGIAWQRGALVDELHTGQVVDLAIRPKLNRWNGRVSVEAEIIDLAIDKN